jgi:uncharacterized protein (DUF1684 family)
VHADQIERPTILEYRRRKDEFFRSHRQSPIPAPLRQGFDGLRYYPDDPAMAFRLPLEPDPERIEVVMRTSSGSERVYERFGWVSLPISGLVARLAVFSSPGNPRPEEFFVPFRDATSGSETYGAGRYLEAGFDGECVMLDLNLAYNPNCAYGDGWNCPVPPTENWLSAPIHAGEMAFVPDTDETDIDKAHP